MDLLIDGYNLLHATDLFGAGAAAGTLEGSRDALLAFLAGRLTPSERRRTTIVFDAAAAPPGMPATIGHESMTVRFARDYPDADTMIEAILESRPRGKGLLVVSGDRRVQRAARQRGARWQDAAEWHRELRRRSPQERGEPEKGDPAVGDAEFWTSTFADEPTLKALADDAAAPPPPPPSETREKTPPTKKKQPFGEGVFEGFPPGYADDLARQMDERPDGQRKPPPSPGE